MLEFSTLLPPLLGAAFLAQMAYWGIIFSRLATYRPPSSGLLKKDVPPVSIVICAKNEEANLSKNLPKILQQTYPNFEVVVVNDGSTDATAEVLQGLERTAVHLRVLHLTAEPRAMQGKKYALSKGIAHAQHDLLLLTDADCRPASDRWLATMVAHQTDGKEMVLGYGAMEKTSGLLNDFIRFQTVYVALQYFGFALVGLPYMGVGRNLMYRRTLFDRIGGFERHRDVRSGDDDLFVNQAANSDNTTLCLDPQAFTYSESKPTWRSYWRQQNRHLTTARRYSPIHQFLLGGLSLSHFGFYALLGLQIATKGSLMVAFGWWLLRSVVVLWVWKKVLKLLKEDRLWAKVLFLDLFFILYYVIFTPALFRKNSRTWT